MEFLLYLNPTGQEIYKLISNKVKVVENTPICRRYDIYGWFDYSKETMTFCTDKIKSKGNGQYDVAETLYHEATHIAQYCKYKIMSPFYISQSLMPLSQRRQTDLYNSISMSTAPNAKQIEWEAFWMEDKPDKIESVLKKYCF